MHRLRGLYLLALWSLVSAAHAETVPLVEYIDALRERGVAILYSDNLVRADTTIDVDAAAPDIAALERALPSLGLALAEGPGGALLIVRAEGPRYVLNGIVRSSSGVRVAGAVVESNRGEATVADRRGVFSLEVAPGEALTLTVSAPGYQRGELRDVDVRGAAANGVQVTLAPERRPLDTIVVSASRYQLAFEGDEGATLIESEALDTLPLLNGETVRAVGLLPSATAVGVDTRLHVRGGAYDETLYVLDGVRIYEPFHLRGFQTPASIFNSAAVDALEFYSGAFPARYGDRMSAVLSVALRDPAERQGSEIDISTLNTSLTHSGARDDKRLGWLVSARRSNLDLVLDRLDQDYGAPRYGEALARATWRPSERHALSANLLFVKNKVALSTPDGETAGSDVTSNYGWLRWRYTPSAPLEIDTVVSVTDVDSRRDGTRTAGGPGGGRVDDERAFRVLSLTQDWRWRRSPALVLSAGIDLKYVEARYRYASELALQAPFDDIGVTPAGGTRALGATPEGGQYAAWADARWRLGRWVIEAGGRWDIQAYTTASDDSQVSPRVTASFDAGERTELRIGWGRHYQAQGVNELPVAAGVATFSPAQRSEHIVASVEHQFRRPYRLRIDAYSKRERTLLPRYENLFDPLVLLPELQYDWVRIDREAALHRGVEIMLSRDRLRGPWSWWLGYAWSDSVEDTPEGRVRTSWDQTHAFRAGLHWQRGAWDVTLTGVVRDGWPRTALSAAVDAAGDIVLTAGRRNAVRAPTYHTLDLHIARAFAVPRGDLSVYLDVNNVYDRRNLCCVEYAIETGPQGEPALAADPDGWLPLVPTLGINWRF